MIDEENSEAIRDREDIIPALNRAQDSCSNLLARHYESPLLAYTEVSLTGGQREYDIPSDVMEDRLEKIEVKIGSYYQEVKRVSYRDATALEMENTSQLPTHYSIIGKKFRLYPNVSSTHPLRVWYLKDPGTLVAPQGRIVLVNEASNYLTVDEVGDDVDTDITSFGSYINVVDGETGLVKATLQVQSVSGTRVTFKSTPSRSEVLGRTVVGTLVDADIQPDDFICNVAGVCVPFLKKPLANFMIQFAVAELTRKLGGAADMEQRILKDLEKVVEGSWVGRESTIRVKDVKGYMGGRRIRPFLGNRGN